MQLLGETTGPADGRYELSPLVEPASLSGDQTTIPSSETRRESGPPTRRADLVLGHHDGRAVEVGSTGGSDRPPAKRRLLRTSTIGALAAGLVVAGVASARIATADDPLSDGGGPAEGAVSVGPADPSAGIVPGDVADSSPAIGDDGATADVVSDQQASDQATEPLAAVPDPIVYRLASNVGSDLAVVPQEQLIVVPTVLGDVFIWDTDDPEQLPTVYIDHIADGTPTDPKSLEAAVALSDGRIASGGAGSNVHVWDPTVHPGVLEVSFGDHEGAISSLAELRDGRIASGSLDGTVRIHDPSEPSRLATIFGQHQAPIAAITILPDGRVASAARSQVLIWNADDPNAPPIEHTVHLEPITSIVALPDGRIASASQDGTVLVWDPDDLDRQPVSFDRHPAGAIEMAVLGNGRVASASGDTVLVWDPDDPDREPIAFDEHEARVTAVTTLPDGRIATAGLDETVRIWHPDQVSAGAD